MGQITRYQKVLLHHAEKNQIFKWHKEGKNLAASTIAIAALQHESISFKSDIFSTVLY